MLKPQTPDDSACQSDQKQGEGVGLEVGNITTTAWTSRYKRPNLSTRLFRLYSFDTPVQVKTVPF